MRYEQSSTVPPLANSEADSDIFDAAQARAQYWKYGHESNWQVEVEVPNAAGRRSGKTVQVQKRGNELKVVHR